MYDWRLVQGAEQSIYRKLGDLYVSIKNEIPIDRVDIVRKVKTDLRAYKRLKKELVMELDSGRNDGGCTEIAATTAAGLMNKLLQICNGSVYDEEHAWHEIGVEKLDALDELIEAADDNMIVFYRYRADLERIQKRHSEAVLLQGEAQGEQKDGAADERIQGGLHRGAHSVRQTCIHCGLHREHRSGKVSEKLPHQGVFPAEMLAFVGDDVEHSDHHQDEAEQPEPTDRVDRRAEESEGVDNKAGYDLSDHRHKYSLHTSQPREKEDVGGNAEHSGRTSAPRPPGQFSEVAA